MARIEPHAALALLTALLGAACASTSREHHYFHKEEKPHAAEWGYTGATGPDHWGDLDPSYALAKDGHMQSPIDISAPQNGEFPPLSFDYGTVSVDIVYNGHTVGEEDVEGSSIQLGDTRYELKQFHFHSPSEHTVSGRHYPLEMHFVHKSDADVIAVVSVLIQEGAENPAFAALWDYLPSEANKKRTADVQVDVAALLPPEHSSFRYEGSLTTPPCTEGVHWAVLRTPVTLSSAQLAALREVIDGNNRPTQALNGRQVIVAGS